MKSVKKYETFEELKAQEPQTLTASAVLKNHQVFDKMIAELLAAKKQRNNSSKR